MSCNFPEVPSMPAKKFSRRSFLKRTGLALSAPLICPFPLFGANPPSNRLNLALMGCGMQGLGTLFKTLINSGENLIAICEVDDAACAKAIKAGGEKTVGIKTYRDYRKMLDEEKSLDGVLIAVPDHWHAILCTAFLKAGKHVFCEKPLTRTIGETRDLSALVDSCAVATQMGNHGSCYNGMRRSIELIQAGALGRVQSAYVLAPGERYPTGINRPPGEDKVPETLDWDFWLGPSPVRPYKKGIYHPYQWRGWLDFGTGQIGNWACHSLNLPVRALNLGCPERVEIAGEGFGFEAYWKKGVITSHFAVPNQKEEFTVFWHENMPVPEAFQEQAPDLKEGVLLVGENGWILTDPHNGSARIKLKGEPNFRDVNYHEATKSVPVRLPRGHNITREWFDACKGGPKPSSDFKTAAHLTEIALTGLLAVQLGHGFRYDASKGEAVDEPEGAKFIRQPVRSGYTV
jgi:predicted dehydrogenase